MPDQKNKDRIQLLAQKLADGNISEAERIEFDQWYNSFDDAILITNKVKASAIKKSVYKKIILRESIKEEREIGVLKRWKILGIAASSLIILTVGAYFLKPHKTIPNQVVSLKAKSDILPGANKATLTLANGKRILLNDANNGQLALQAGAIIIKKADGELIYHKQDDRTPDNKSYNTIETPKGGQYQINLPDGTKVWLNAASSLRYPTAFTNGERKVKLSGEAYFEVAKNMKLPFKVESRGQIVEVLGTHFNISSYADEPNEKTTLLEGSVRVSRSNDSRSGLGKSLLLKPYQQAVNTSDNMVAISIDPEAEVAWKDGLFQFKDTPLKTIMRQMARWYNVDIKYEGNIPNREFTGKLYRSVSAAEFLRILEYSNIHYVIDNRTITIKI